MIAGREFTYSPACFCGLDFGYDGSVGDIVKVDGINRGVDAEADTSDYSSWPCSAATRSGPIAHTH